MNLLGGLQKLGRSLQLPIAVLPAAALLLRFGQPDLLNIAFIAEAGGAIFGNLALIFAIGVAASWSKDNAGPAALAGAVGYLILTKAMTTIDPKINMGVLAGIITGLIAGACYNRFHDIKLPDFLAFFGGKRFVPIITGFISLILAGILGYVWPPVQNVIHAGGEWMVSVGALGSGIFGLINRLLIPTGLHQVLNTIAWFQIGDFSYLKDGVQTVAHGDLSRFYAGDTTAGMFMSGFFPVMMFGLPGAALAMYFAAPKNRRAQVGGLLLSVALTAFLTGVTEPLEFLFMFLAPALYAVHAVLTGISLYIATALGIHAGFSFSAGAIDYVLMYHLPAASSNVWMLLVMGVVWFVLYFVLFTLFIKWFNLKTPGREELEVGADGAVAAGVAASGDVADLARGYIGALGGAANLVGIDACITRLRLQVKDAGLVDEAATKSLGASGVIRLNKQTVQVIVGPKAEKVAEAMQAQVAGGAFVKAAAPVAPAAPKVVAPAPVAAPVVVPTSAKGLVLLAPLTGNIVPLDQVPDAAFASKAVGDGVAILPTGKYVVAPASGTLVKIFNSNHAFALVADSGAEIIVHIGIETVKLAGKGFTRLAEQGAHVKAGDRILELDLEYLAANAQSLISPVVVSNLDQFAGLGDLAAGSAEAGKTSLYTVLNK